MAKEPTEADLQAFIESAGRSLADAQSALGSGHEIPTALVMANADLEIKTALASDARGRLALQPISIQQASGGAIDPGMLSTLKVSFVATIDDTIQAGAKEPSRPKDDVIAGVRERADLASLDRILGGLKYDATYVPLQERWLVTVRDPQDRLVRELVIPDQVKEGGGG